MSGRLHPHRATRSAPVRVESVNSAEWHSREAGETPAVPGLKVLQDAIDRANQISGWEGGTSNPSRAAPLGTQGLPPRSGDHKLAAISRPRSFAATTPPGPQSWLPL